jgi:hypothetical protein
MVEPDANAVVRWEEITIPPVDDRALDRQPLRDARFALLRAPLSDAKAMRAGTDFVDWILSQRRAKNPGQRDFEGLRHPGHR